MRNGAITRIDVLTGHATPKVCLDGPLFLLYEDAWSATTQGHTSRDWVRCLAGRGPAAKRF